MLIWINVKQIRTIELIEDGIVEVSFEDRTCETYDGEDADVVLRLVKNYFMPIMK
jgi:hypothetical protein